METLNEILKQCPDFYDSESFANGYLKGYKKAEKDNELTWEDIKVIEKLLGFDNIIESPKEFYQEVLKRFNRQRNDTTKRRI